MAKTPKPIVRSGIESYLAAHKANARRPADCGMVLAAQAAAEAGKPWAEVRADLVARPDWHPRFSVDGVVTAATYAEPDRTDTQLFYARTLADGRFEAGARRTAIQRLLRDHGAMISDAAWAVLVEALAGVHDNAKAFLAQPEILSHAPHALDLTGLPSLPRKVRDAGGALVELKDLPLRGGRDAPAESLRDQVARLEAQVERLQAMPKAPISLAKGLAAQARPKG